MVSRNKMQKTNKRNHWGKGGHFLKAVDKFKRYNFFTSSYRKQLKKDLQNKIEEHKDDN